MSEADWTPALTQIQGAGARTVIGLLDFTVVNAPDVQNRIVKSGDISTFSDGHGAAVASLIVSAHDGTGVMGIAPSAQVVAYNPFDASGTAGWPDVTNGVAALLQNKASVINASLGVPGVALPADWNTVFNDKSVKSAAKNAVFVIAAGNSGVSQTGKIEWNEDNPHFLLVGSIDPNLVISDFSNQPGTACLTDDDDCDGDYLKKHFIVAPGEFILVSDDNGGFTRMSGTHSPHRWCREL